MRLGARKTILQPGTLAWSLYGKADDVSERHRHRYEINPLFVKDLESKGMIFSGRDETGMRMEIVELDRKVYDHPYFVAVQFHPEFKSRPQRPSPVFLELLKAVKKS